MDALLLCAGKSQRARNSNQKKTKLLLRVNKTTIIEHNLKKISNIDLDQIFVNLHFQKDALKKKIIQFSKKKKLKIKFLLEKKLKGTCGTLFSLKKKVKNNIMVIYPDNLSDCNYKKLINFHFKTKSKITICAYLSKQTASSGVIKIDKNNNLKSFIEKPKKYFPVKQWCNAGIYIFNQEILKNLRKKDIDFSNDFFPKMIRKKINIKIFKINKLLTFDTPELYEKNKINDL